MIKTGDIITIGASLEQFKNELSHMRKARALQSVRAMFEKGHGEDISLRGELVGVIREALVAYHLTQARDILDCIETYGIDVSEEERQINAAIAVDAAT